MLGGMIMGIGFCAGLLNSVVMALAFGQSITGTMFKDMLLILLGGVLILLIGIPIYQRFSAKSIERFWNVLFVVGVLAFFLGFVIMLLIVKDLEQMRVLFNNFSRVICSFLKQILDFAPFMLPLLPLLMVGSFTLSVRWYQRREV